MVYHPAYKQKGLIMESFDYHKMSKLVFPPGINEEDRDHMIISLQDWIKHNNTFLEQYGTYTKWQAETKSVRRGIERMQKEIVRLKEIGFPQ